MITLFKPNETNFNANGLGNLDKYLLNDVVTWKDNGQYSFQFSYPVFAPLGTKIKGEYVVRVPTPTGNQLFRIHRPRIENGMLHIDSLHISYDLSKNLIEDTFIVDKNGSDAINQMASKLQFKQPFTFSSDIKTINSSRVVRKNPIQFLIDSGLDNSFVNRWGGHLIRDNFHLSMVENPERNKVVTLRDRKNVKGYTSDLDYEPIATRIMPQCFDGLFLPEKYIDSPLIKNYPYPRIQVVEFSDIKAEKDGQLDNEGTVPLNVAYDLMRKRTRECYSKLDFDKPAANYSIDFIELKKTDQYEEFAEIEDIKPNDRVNFIHDGDLEITSNLIAFTFRPSTEEYLTMELGNFKSTFVSVMNEIQSVGDSIPIISNDISKNHTDTARGAYGGSVILMNPKDVGQGTSEKPFLQVFMNRNTLKSSDRFLVLNSQGLGFIKGPFDLSKFSASWGIDGVLTLGEGMLKIGTDKLGRYLETTDRGLQFFNKDISIGRIGTSAKSFAGVMNPADSKESQRSLALELDTAGEFIQLVSGKETGLFMPNPEHYKSGADILLVSNEPNIGVLLRAGGAGVSVAGPSSLSKGKVSISAPNGFYINGQLYVPGGTGGNNGGGNLGSREDYAKNMITDLFSADYEKVYASYLNFPRIQNWGIANRTAFNELNEIIRLEGVSPVFFWAYEGSEGYHPDLSFLNHFYRDGSNYKEEARRTARWVKETSLQNGSLAWYDAQYPYYTSPPDKQEVGNAYMADTKPGMIARVMLQGTAAATWAMFDPDALKGSVNGVQDYADPFAHQISLIKSWQTEMKYIKPMSQYTVTSEFGWRDAPMNPGTMEFHNAIDLASSSGRGQIFASNDGVVIRADGSYWDWYGNFIVIQHSDGLFTGYAHLSQINVSVGQKVSRGQLIGVEGSTGPVTGPHLHFQFSRKDPIYSTNNDFENPRKYIEF